MSKINDGGAAFPTLWDSQHNADWQTDGGLTKREYFAGRALQGILASEPETFFWNTLDTAIRSVEFADALIAALAKGGDA